MAPASKPPMPESVVNQPVFVKTGPDQLLIFFKKWSVEIQNSENL
jgi:hypothetical protein